MIFECGHFRFRRPEFREIVAASHRSAAETPDVGIAFGQHDHRAGSDIPAVHFTFFNAGKSGIFRGADCKDGRKRKNKCRDQDFHAFDYTIIYKKAVDIRGV